MKMMVEIEEAVGSPQALPLLSLNHVSLLVNDVFSSVRFYEDVLGFCLVKRPSSFNFHGAWSALISYLSTHNILQFRSACVYICC